ncbi:GGDEF domain-containing protein [Clostridium chrysemydis]|uniref:GGDEF domain-containing protein n=1 Tax=Clostridium chrysemydis TaxID=2665504 RepID=UPI0018832317|nr:GGDEF domain-containing protein [Clostridium chrysemydis]
MDEFKNFTKTVRKIYSGIRVIDSNFNCIIGDKEFKGLKCYEIWEQGKKCDICIYDKALKDEKPVIKVVNFNEDTYVIKAVAVKIGALKYVVEFIDKIGNRLYYESKYSEYKGKSYMIQVDNSLKGIVLDGLTGLYNRKYIDTRLKSDIEDSFEYNEPLSILMIDIDFFKKVNDTYGHVVGDKILKRFAKILEENFKDTNNSWIGRYGGEEFISIIPNGSKAYSKKIAEDLRKNIEKEEFKVKENIIKITCSIGIYTMEKEKLEIDELIEKADLKLYMAKELGRNRVK